MISKLQAPTAGAAGPRPATGAAPDLGTSPSLFAGEVTRDFVQLGFKDGDLSQQQIDGLMANPQVKGHEAAVVAALDDMSKGNGVTVAELQQYNAAFAKNPSNSIDNNFSWYCKRVDAQNPALFAHQLPDFNAVQQGHLGDCYVLSPISAATRLNPQATKNMITDDHNGNFTVKFPGQPDPITVSAPTTAQMARYCTSGADGTWASVLEKAYAVTQAKPGSTDPYQSLGQGGYAQGLELMTGKAYKAVNLAPMTPEQRLQTLQPGINAGVPQTVVSTATVLDGVPADHMVGLEGYNPQQGSYLLRNPWGEETPDSHIQEFSEGEFAIPSSDFQQVFQTAYIPDQQ